jgi:hypothetical protein
MRYVVLSYTRLTALSTSGARPVDSPSRRHDAAKDGVESAHSFTGGQILEDTEVYVAPLESTPICEPAG